MKVITAPPGGLVIGENPDGLLVGCVTGSIVPSLTVRSGEVSPRPVSAASAVDPLRDRAVLPVSPFGGMA